MKAISIIALTFISLICYANKLPADTLASFPGGDIAFDDFIARNIRTTKMAIEKNITGDVIVSFTIDVTGRAGEFSVKQPLGYGCDEEAIRVLQSMPVWQPQVIDNRRVKSTLSKKIHFAPGMTLSDRPGPKNTSPDVSATYGNGQEDLAMYLNEKFQYPKSAKNAEGFVVIRFMVDEKGALSEVYLVSGIQNDVDNEIVRIMNGMDNWSPKRVKFIPGREYRELVFSVKKKKLLIQELK